MSYDDAYETCPVCRKSLIEKDDENRGRHANCVQVPQARADWMRAAASDWFKHTSQDKMFRSIVHEGASILDYMENELASIIAKHTPHCPNAAGDAREVISAKEFVTWLTAKYEKTEHQPTAWAVSGELNHMMEERERAKASQTPSDHA